MAKVMADGQGSPPLGDPQRSSGERSERERSGGSPNGAREPGVIEPRNVEVLEKPKRRRFNAEYKARILRDADASPPGGIGALLRREGLYFSHLITWRKQRDKGGLAALEPKQRGPKSRKPSAEALQIIQLERENRKLQHRLKQAETIIEFQKKVHEILGIPLGTPPEEDVPT